MKTAYFILGMHRSGTSALGGVLDLIGLEFGSDLMKADAGNPKGYFENNFVYMLNKKILSESGASWDDYNFTINKIVHNKKKSYIKEAKKIIKKEFRYSESFAIKDPRICLLFPIWEQACLELKIKIKIILPFRNPMEVAASLRKRNNFSMEKSFILWSHHFLSAEYFSRKYDRMFTSFDDLLDDTTTTIDYLYNFIGFKGQQKRKVIEKFLDNNLKYNNLLMENFTKETPTFLQKLLTLLKESKFDDLDILDNIRNDFYFSLEMFQHEEVNKDISDKKEQSIQLAEQDKKLTELKKKIDLLEQIKEITVVDETYYKNRYPDLVKYKGALSEHYYRYGKKENRTPNEYCEYYGIDTQEKFGNDEILYSKKAQIEEQIIMIKRLNEKDSTSIIEKSKLEKELEVLNINLIEQENIIVEEKSKLEEQSKRVTVLSKKIDLLEAIQDIAVVDEVFYKNKYPDLVKYKGSLSEHYYKYGKKENRQPNEYCEYYSINTQKESAHDEILYSNRVEINEQNLMIKSLKEQESVNVNQKLKLEEEIELLNKSLDEQESINVAEKLKLEEEIELLNKSLDEQESINVEEKLKLEEEIKVKIKEIEQKNIFINNLRVKTNNLEKIAKNRENELKIQSKNIKLLNQNIDDIVEDLATIKEHKCWIYTKPIRDLQKVLRG